MVEPAEKTIVSAIEENGKQLRIKTKTKTKEKESNKVKVKKNGETVEVEVPEMSKGLSQSVAIDAIGMAKKEARAFYFKEYPEYGPARREVGDRVRGLAEDGLSFIPRQTAKVRHSAVGATAGILFTAALTGAVGYLLYGDYQSKKGL